MTPLSRSFYENDTVSVAKELLGKLLVRKLDDKLLVGKIIETEAYRHSDDPASHAYRGKTERNKAMFEQVGRAYVYFTYGMHYCVNAVAHKEMNAGAVLIRAIEPLKGIDIMIKNRKIKNESTLTDGPAKLTQALKITKKQYGVDLTRKTELYIADGERKSVQIVVNNRIGIKNGVDKKWNFKIANENLSYQK